MKKLDEALNVLEMTSNEVIEIGHGILDQYITDTDKLMYQIENLNDLPNDTLRFLMLKLQQQATNFVELKERALLKSQIAETLRKEKYAEVSTMTTGTISTKDATATLQSSEQVVVEALYDYISNVLKGKQDEIHRMIDVIKVTIMSRNQEAKVMVGDLSVGAQNER